MSALRKVLRASWQERRALVWAGMMLPVVRILLSVLPLRTVLGLVERLARVRRKKSGSDSLARLVWAIDVMGHRMFPGDPCLTQAVLVHALLRRWGRPSRLRIGVRREDPARLEAHAWVESDEGIVIGEVENPDQYIPLPPLRLGG